MIDSRTEAADEESPGTAVAAFVHDARTPLTSIIGFSELLLEDESLTGQAREYLEIINNEGKTLAAILERFSRQSKR